MNLQETNISLFNRLRFVLVEPSHPGNIGATARAMKTMGFSKLVLVNPRFPNVVEEGEAIAFASGAQDILAQAYIAGSIEEALHGCNFAAALTSRLREFSPPVIAPRALASQLAINSNLNAALVFGNERCGLSNDVVEKCNVLISIPTNSEYSSLNLAQAVQVLAYECRLASLEAMPPVFLPLGFIEEPADILQIDGMYAHLEQALIALEFLEPNNPKKLLPRLKRLFSRTQLEIEEVNILRGIARQILRKLK